jgi:hypothetical protein
MKQLALGMIAYSDEHQGRLPPAVVYGKDGKPLHSWRVLILPYIEQQKLYDEFKLDEPWDSPHNIALLEKMPAAYAPPPGKRSKVPAYHTVCHVFVGKGTALAGRDGPRYPADFLHGTSQTILLIEAGNPVPWTKPEELTYDPDQPLPVPVGLFKNGFRVAMADGSAHFVNPKEVTEETMRKVIERDYLDPISSEW